MCQKPKCNAYYTFIVYLLSTFYYTKYKEIVGITEIYEEIRIIKKKYLLAKLFISVLIINNNYWMSLLGQVCFQAFLKFNKM